MFLIRIVPRHQSCRRRPRRQQRFDRAQTAMVSLRANSARHSSKESDGQCGNGKLRGISPKAVPSV